MQRLRSILGGIVFSAALASGSAEAATITYSGAADNIFTNGGDSAFTWAQFNPSAGLLSAVTFEVAGAFTFSIASTAPAAVAPAYVISKGFTLNGTGLAPRSPFSGPFDGVVNVGALSAPSGLLQPGTVDAQTVTLDFLRLPDFGLAPFIGTGSIATDLGLSEDSDLCTAGDGSAARVNCTQTGHLTVSVTYDYTPAAGRPPAQSAPVPEPSTLLLFGLGLSAAAFSTLRRPSPSRR